MTSSFQGLTQELLFLDPDDDLATVRAKLESSAADEIYLIVPANASILRTPLEFRMLGRLASELSSETIIVTPDGRRRYLAQQEGFRTKRSWRQLRHLLSPDARPSLLSTLSAWIPLPSARAGVMAASLSLVLLALGFIVVPEMRVTLTPRTDTFSQVVEVVVQPEALRVDPLRRILPGRRLERRIEVTANVPATGSGQVGRGRALGEVTFYNRGREEVRVPEGTIIKTADGIRFSSSTEVAVPPSTPTGANVAIVAVDPGTSGNVPARAISQIEGDHPSELTVSNQRPTTGGTDRQTRIVAEQDVAQLRDQLLRQARDEAAVELQTNAGDSVVLAEETLDIRPIEERLEPDVGAIAEQVSGRLVFNASVLAMKREDLAQVIRQTMSSRLDSQFRMAGGEPSIRSLKVVSSTSDAMTLRAEADAVIVRELDSGQLRSALVGKSADEARAVLSGLQGLASPPSLELWPSWSPRAFRVAIDVAAPR